MRQTDAGTASETGKKPAKAQRPAAGICPAVHGEAEVVGFELHRDTPEPRCAQVGPSQKLRVRNATDETVQVALGRFDAVLEPDDAVVFDEPFGDFLEPGVHSVTTSAYGGGGPRVWLSVR